MRRVLLFVITAVALLLGIAMAEEQGRSLVQAVEEGTIIRLHVVAAGNDPENQRIKYAIRDQVLDAWGTTLSKADEASDMMALLMQNRWCLEETARYEARRQGYMGKVRAQVGVFAFPERIYGDVRVPAGNYRALRIVLGEGEGRNWWCVLFPQLCLPLASGEPAWETAPIGDSVLFTWLYEYISPSWPPTQAA